MSRALAGLAAALGLACAGVPGAPRPDWVDGAPADWPADRFVRASASGSDAESARTHARAELARVFHSRIESEVRDRSEATTASGDGEAPRSTVVQKLSIDTRVRTEGDFEGVRVPELWHDADAGLWYALAVVDKAELRKALDAQLAETARRIQGHLDRARSAATPLGRARALLDAARVARERALLAARARVVGAPADPFRPTLAEIDRQLDAVLWEARFQVVAREVDPRSGAPGAPLPRLREAFEQRLTGIGFRLAGDGQDANLLLSARMVLEEVPRGFDGHFVRWEGAYELSGAAPDGAVLFSSQGSGGESYSTLEIARTRALARGARQLADDLQGQISRYLQEPDDH